MASDKILIIEDNHQIADFMANRVLPSLGYQTLIAYTGNKALELLRSTKISLMLIDLQLPDIYGLDLLRKIIEEGITIPAIATTAHGSEQIVVEAFRLGVRDYLIKPVDAITLERTIKRALSETHLVHDESRLTSQLREQINWLSTLSRVGRSVTSTLELDEVLRRIVEAGVSLTRAEEGFLALLDEKTGQLYLRAAKNIDEERVKTMRLPVVDTLLGEVVKNGRPLRRDQADRDQRLKVSTGYLVHSLLHVPILSKGRVLGVLSADNQITARPFNSTDESLLTSLADYAAIALENARLYERSQQEISNRLRTERALRESEERYALAVQGAKDGIWDWNLITNEIYLSPRWKSMLGYEDDEIFNSPREWFSRVHTEDIERLRLDISAHVKGVTEHFENEHRMLHKDGSYRWMLSRGMAVRDGDNTANRLAGSQTDFTDRKYAEEKLLHNAFYDTLTSLPNRALFLERLRYSVERAKRRKDYLFAVLFLDLDRFKNVNDSLGHIMGDRLLIAIANRLNSGLRATDTVARQGGDEFVILLEDITNDGDATQIAEWIHNELASTFSIDGHEIFITASIGIVLSMAGYDRPEDVLRDADIAMYSAKASGKAHYEIFEPEMRDRVMDRLGLETELRRALERNEFEVYYQPIVSLFNGSLSGFEALLRWRHPDRGILQPGVFIPLAEETGLIIAMDRWVLMEACRQLKEWQDMGQFDPPLTISVNLSGKQVVQPGLVERVEEVLRETGLDPQSLKLEMTENAIMENNKFTIDVFTSLRGLGVQVQIDDFGVGYSSLTYLSQFPINALKIDQTFVRMMNRDNNQLKIVQAIVMLTNRLGVGVIAEGMETESQMEQLKELGCEYGQGNLISAPLSRQAMGALLSNFPRERKDFIAWYLAWKQSAEAKSPADAENSVYGVVPATVEVPNEEAQPSPGE